jgi:Alginate export
MKQIFILILFSPAFLMFFTGSLKAQFTISGEFKLRGEYRDGYLIMRDSSKTPYTDILGRARLLFDYRHEKISTRFSLFNAWVFGQNNYSSDTITKNTVNIYEAWFKYDFTENFSFKIGRTEVSYDDERFFGVSNWSMWGATHDIMIARWEAPDAGYKGDMGLALNNAAPATAYLNSYNLRNNYKYMAYLWEHEKFFNDKLEISFLGVVDAFQKSSITTTLSKMTYDTLYIHNLNDSIIGTTILPVVIKTTSTNDFPTLLYARATIGADIWLNLKKWSFFLTWYYQSGHYKDGRKLSSNFYSAYISYQVIKPLKLLVGYDHLSGNDYSDTILLKTKVTGFSTLYGTSHRGYGYMDLFTSLVKDNLSPGLNDLYLRGTIGLNDKMSIEATWRWFSLPQSYLYIANPKKGTLPYQKVDKILGSEIDMMYVYKPIPNLELNAAYCFFLPTKTMELFSNLKARTSKWAQYVYVMITYKPNFFSSEKK